MRIIFFAGQPYNARQVIRDDDVTGYRARLTEIFAFGPADFNPTDGVMTTHVVNHDFVAAPADYCVVTTDDESVVSSRWYVVEAVRIRGGQFNVTLLRDVLAEWRENVLGAPAFIRKATLTADDPMLFNSENMTFNQIRRNPFFITDNTKIPWIVGYIPRDAFPSEQTVTAEYPTSRSADITVENVDEWLEIQGESRTVALDVSLEATYIRVTSVPMSGAVPMYTAGTRIAEWFNTTIKDAGMSTRTVYNVDDAVPEEGGNVFRGTYNSGFRSFWSPPTGRNVAQVARNYAMSRVGLMGVAEAKIRQSLNGQVIEDSTTGRRYRISILTETVDGALALPDNPDAAYYGLFDDLQSGWTRDEAVVVAKNAPRSAWKVLTQETVSTIVLEQITQTVKVKIPVPAERDKLVDAPYDMFFIPYGKIGVQLDGQTTTTEPEAGPAIATSIALTSGSGTIYDIQIVPFCPEEMVISSSGTINADANKGTAVTDNGGRLVTVMFFSRKSSRSFMVEPGEELKNLLTPPQDAVERKIRDATELWRLCSPNFSGAFDFSAVKNGGVSSFTVDITYRPFSPYIRVAPTFGGLYGGIGDRARYDARGLICGGSFSVAQLTSAWADYQLQNSNYERIFDRQIQSMDRANAVQDVVDVTRGLTTLAGGVAGVVASGGSASSIVGLVGGAVNAGVGIAARNELYQEQRDMKIDLFGYQLGNVKAIPSSLAKTGSQTVNNPNVIILEHYTATPEEEEALRLKLYYNGMTVMRIGMLGSFVREDRTFIQADLIRVEGTGEDDHVIRQIKREMEVGAWI